MPALVQVVWVQVVGAGFAPGSCCGGFANRGAVLAGFAAAAFTLHGCWVHESRLRCCWSCSWLHKSWLLDRLARIGCGCCCWAGFNRQGDGCLRDMLCVHTAQHLILEIVYFYLFIYFRRNANYEEFCTIGNKFGVANSTLHLEKSPEQSKT